MPIVIAPDSFKGSLTSRQVAQIIADILAKIVPTTEIIQCPLADGGEGTAEILAPHLPGDICLIESAQLVGLNLPEMRSLDVMERGSAPLGNAILAGLDAGKRDFVIGLGGSATNDCGLGMLMALGMEAIDYAGLPVTPDLAGLLSLAFIDNTGLDARLNESRLTVLSDVVSPLCGKNGATAVYGPQKGVQAGDIERVDRAMQQFAQKCMHQFGSDPSPMPGAGAAGGLGFALMLLSGEMVPGAEFVMNATGFSSALVRADWVITGEGRSDAQTLHGKLPMKVAEVAGSAGVKSVLLSGSVDRSAQVKLEKRFDLVIAAQPDEISVDQAMKQAEKLLSDAVKRNIGRFTK